MVKQRSNRPNRIRTHRSADRRWAIHHGDVQDVLPTLPHVNYDAAFFDSPYGLKFMGHDWDGDVPPVVVFESLLRLCKPGAYLLAFGHPKTFHRLACNIEDAGWELRETLSWLYGQGFPKGLDIGNATGMEKWEGYRTALKPGWEPIILAQRKTDGTFAENALAHGTGGLNINDSRIGLASHPGKFPRLADVTGYDNSHREKGRWPSNLLLDEDAATALDWQSGKSKSRQSRRSSVGSNVGNLDVIRAPCNFRMTLQPLLHDPVDVRFADFSVLCQFAVDRRNDLDAVRWHGDGNPRL